MLLLVQKFVFCYKITSFIDVDKKSFRKQSFSSFSTLFFTPTDVRVHFFVPNQILPLYTL